MTRKKSTGFTLVELLVVIAIIGILVALLLPAVQAAREAARRMQCGNNLKQLGLALHNYHDVYKRFPFGVVRFDNTNSGGSVDSWSSNQLTWIARVLPYMEQQQVYDSISFSVHPGTAGVNATAINTELPFTRCPSDRRLVRAVNNRAPTNYVGCIGHDDQPNFSAGQSIQGMMLIFQTTITNGSAVGNGDGISAATVTDGLSNTMALSECKINNPWIYRYAGAGGYIPCQSGADPAITGNIATSGRGYSWMYGTDNQAWTYSTILKPNDRLTNNHECHNWTSTGVMAARSRHPGGVQVAYADGSVSFVSDTIDGLIWRTLGTYSGGEAVSVP